ncbi:MAG TPA: NAD(P)H-dependent glycerol-3-phosphate dehydrogenase [Candidatus Omnitrophota bacterium]|nr:NAD(P)H-dependent glycerol-3-phosphate dehydrogenase [Candidatus Omnitrophota bacterium]HPD85234.1 NAD(P)H-dependent glycerol-3-phosphate dehydrogenase [Candidatus Omnitrophota bacterium]HRZ04265.1 NAD(P)H-dependent glycerol-3-phosphate dehydrogenase [Candidatus Omnitrophota bacterium]
MPNDIKTIAVIGDGGWGTTLAIHLNRKGYQVKLWGAFPEYLDQIRRKRENIKFLPGIKIPGTIIISEDLASTIADAQVIILAVPSRFAVGVIRRLKAFNLSGKIILSVIKGLEPKNPVRMSEVIERELGKIKLAVLSGPTIATEVAQGIPSTAVISSRDMRIAKKLQEVFNSESFRIYINPDLIGVELGGSLKNIIAIACGVCDGLGFGTNAKAAILTRGLTEMARLGVALGAKRETFFGLTGLGDLVTTCVNSHSRNRFVGEQCGRGKSIGEIITSTEMVAEGITTVKAVLALGRKHKVAIPITKEVYNLLYKKKPATKAVSDLMRRKLKTE